MLLFSLADPSLADSLLAEISSLSDSRPALRLRLRFLDGSQPPFRLRSRHPACRHTGCNCDRRCLFVCVPLSPSFSQSSCRRRAYIVPDSRLPKSASAQTRSSSNTPPPHWLASSLVDCDNPHPRLRARRFHAFCRCNACARFPRRRGDLPLER